MKIVFKRDGYDYIYNDVKKPEYYISNYHGLLAVWINDVRQNELFYYLKDAKEYCINKIKKL